MCGENEPPIRVYRFENNGLGGPTEDSIDAILEDVRQELESWADPRFGSSETITLTITTGFMSRRKYDELPEFMPSDKDIVTQAREILRDPTMQPFLFGVTRDTFRALADEVARLREENKHLYQQAYSED